MKLRISTPEGIQTFDSSRQAVSILFEKDEAQCVSQLNAFCNRRFSSVPDTATAEQAIDAADFPDYPAGANYREWAHSSRRKDSK